MIYHQHSPSPKPDNVLLSVPSDTRLAALSAALRPLGLVLHWKPDPRPQAPQNGRRAVVGGAL